MVERTLKDSKVETAERVFQREKERVEGGREMGLILSRTHS